MLDQHTVRRLREMYLTGMADAFLTQAGQPDVQSFDLRRAALVSLSIASGPTGKAGNSGAC